MKLSSRRSPPTNQLDDDQHSHNSYDKQNPIHGSPFPMTLRRWSEQYDVYVSRMAVAPGATALTANELNVFDPFGRRRVPLMVVPAATGTGVWRPAEAHSHRLLGCDHVSSRHHHRSSQSWSGCPCRVGGGGRQGQPVSRSLADTGIGLGWSAVYNRLQVRTHDVRDRKHTQSSP